MRSASLVGQWRQRLNYANLPKLKAWGVEVQSNMSKVNARVLQPPEIIYGGQKRMRANFGQVAPIQPDSIAEGVLSGWNLKGIRFTKPGRPLKSWSVVSFDRNCGPRELREFSSVLV